MKITEYKFLKEYVPLANKFHHYDKKLESIQNDIQKYVQVKLMGEYNPRYMVVEYSIRRAGLDKDKKYLTMKKLEAKYKKIRDNYADLALKWQTTFFKKYSYEEYNKCCKKFFE